MSDTLIDRAKAAIDIWDHTSAVEIEVLTGMVAARQAYYDAPDLVREMVAEIESLRECVASLRKAQHPT